jgi:autotransporter passenger strand-loop-strand repeat protein
MNKKVEVCPSNIREKQNNSCVHVYNVSEKNYSSSESSAYLLNENTRETSVFSSAVRFPFTNKIFNGGKRTIQAAVLAAMLHNNLVPDLQAFTADVGSGTSVNGELVNSDGQLIINGGIAVSGMIDSGGFQHIHSGGTAVSTTINVNGTQFVENGGSARNVIINSGGEQYLSNNWGSTQRAVVNGITINDGGKQYILGYGGTAISTTINSGGIQEIHNGAIVSSVAIKSGGTLRFLNIYGDSNEWGGGSAYGVVLSSGGIINVNLGTFSSYIATRLSGSNVGGNSFSILSGSASGMILYSGAIQHIYSGGIANGTVVNSGAYFYVHSGGSAVDIKQNIGVNIITDVGKTDSNLSSIVANGTNGSNVSFSLSNGVASNWILYSGASGSNGAQNIFDGGSAYNTIIHSGAQQIVKNGGSTVNASVFSGGEIVVENGAYVNNVSTNSGVNFNVLVENGLTTYISGNNGVKNFYLSNGTASGFILYSGGKQDIGVGGKTDDIIINSGANLNISSGNASATSVTQSSDGNINVVVGKSETLANIYVSGNNASGDFSLVGGVARNFIIYNGAQQVSSGGTAINTIMFGGAQNVSSGATASGTTIQGSAFGSSSINKAYQNVSSGGSALSTHIKSGGVQILYGNAFANSTFISSGGSLQLQMVYNSVSPWNAIGGAAASNVVQSVGGNIFVGVGSSGTNDALNTFKINGTNASGIDFSLLNGIANNFILYSGGFQTVQNGGVASNTTINSGASQILSSGGISSENLGAGGKAVNTIVNDGGVQFIGKDASASNTTVNSGGVINISGAGILNGAVLNSGAVLSFGSFYKDGANALSNITINSGGIVDIRKDMESLGSSGNKVTINNFSAASGASADMNIWFGADDSYHDELVLNDSFNGNLILKVHRIGGSGAKTKKGMKLVDVSNNITGNGIVELYGEKIDIGAYEYKLSKGSEAGIFGIGEINDYFLRSTLDKTNTFKSILNIPGVIVLTAAEDLKRTPQNLIGRLNDKRTHRLWFDIFSQNLSIDNEIKTDFSIFQAAGGYEYLLDMQDDKVLLFGITAGVVASADITTKQDNELNGKGSLNIPNLGVYGSFITSENFFINLSLRGFFASMDMKDYSPQRDEYKYEPKMNLLGINAEFGKQFNLSNFEIIPKIGILFINVPQTISVLKDSDIQLKISAANYITAKEAVAFKYRDMGVLSPYFEIGFEQALSDKFTVDYADEPVDVNIIKQGISAAVGTEIVIGKMLLTLDLKYNRFPSAVVFGGGINLKTYFGGKRNFNTKNNKDDYGLRQAGEAGSQDNMPISEIPQTGYEETESRDDAAVSETPQTDYQENRETDSILAEVSSLLTVEQAIVFDSFKNYLENNETEKYSDDEIKNFLFNGEVIRSWVKIDDNGNVANCYILALLIKQIVRK